MGASQATPIDVRIISATHRDLEAAMASAQFREDLYYRLNVVSLVLPTGRAARGHCVVANHFLDRLSRKYDKRLSGFCARGAQGADHRRLAGQRSPALQRGRAGVRPVHHPGALTLVQRAPHPVHPGAQLCGGPPAFRARYLVGLLKMTDGNVADARAAGATCNRTEFYRLLQKARADAGAVQAGCRRCGRCRG